MDLWVLRSNADQTDVGCDNENYFVDSAEADCIGQHSFVLDAVEVDDGVGSPFLDQYHGLVEHMMVHKGRNDFGDSLGFVPHLLIYGCPNYFWSAFEYGLGFVDFFEAFYLMVLFDDVVVCIVFWGSVS